MIKLSAKGIEINHARYISDSATGLFFIFFIFILEKYGDFEIMGLSKIITSISISDPGNIVAFIFLFLLHPAIGLLISFFSWISLEIIYIKLIEKIWFNNKFPAKLIQFDENFELLKNKYSIKYENWHSTLIDFEEDLLINDYNLDIVYLRRSIRLFLRNISFILLLIAMICIYNYIYLSVLLIIFSIFLLLLSGAIGFFSNLHLLFKYNYKVINQAG